MGFGAQLRVFSQRFDRGEFGQARPHRPSACQFEQRTCIPFEYFFVIIVRKWIGFTEALKQTHDAFLSASLDLSAKRAGMTAVRSATNQPGRAVSGEACPSINCTNSPS